MLPLVIFIIVSLVASVIMLFVEGSKNTNYGSFFDTFWWSIVTMSTTGYGDIVPHSTGGRVIALLTILAGVLTTALLTGTIASGYLSQVSRVRSGLMDFKQLRDHIVICGWRGDMISLLKTIVDYEKIPINKIVVVADVLQENIDRIFETPELSDFNYVRGVFYDKDVLQKANIRQAKKAVVLADQTMQKTDFEVDSQTVMAVISIKTLNKSIHVSAQLIEKNFEVYLQRARCDEIMFAKIMNTDILSHIINENGMSNIIASLIGSNEHSCKLIVEKLKPSFAGKTYQDVCDFAKSHFPHTTPIGLLENVGSQHKIMDHAIREAQRTANFPEMLSNLRQVQTIKPYNPKMVPPADYIIKQNSGLILLGG